MLYQSSSPHLCGTKNQLILRHPSMVHKVVWLFQFFSGQFYAHFSLILANKLYFSFRVADYPATVSNSKSQSVLPCEYKMLLNYTVFQESHLFILWITLWHSSQFQYISACNILRKWAARFNFVHLALKLTFNSLQQYNNVRNVTELTYLIQSWNMRQAMPEQLFKRTSTNWGTESLSPLVNCFILKWQHASCNKQQYQQNSSWKGWKMLFPSIF